MEGKMPDSSEDQAKEFVLGLRRLIGARIGEHASMRFASDAGPDALFALLTDAFAFGETTLAGIAQQNPPEKPIACRAGCSHCCKRASVDTTAPDKPVVTENGSEIRGERIVVDGTTGRATAQRASATVKGQP